MIIRDIEIPDEWKYLFVSVYVRQFDKHSYNGTTSKSDLEVFAYIKPEYIKQYQAYCAIDTDFKIGTVSAVVNRNPEESTYIQGKILPFSERFFVPNIFNLGFVIPLELSKKLVELSNTSKPIT